MSFEIAITSSPSLSFSSSSSLSLSSASASVDAPHMESSSCSEHTSTLSLSLSPNGWSMSPHQWSQEEGHKMFPPSPLSLGHASSPCASTSHSFTLQPPSQSTSTLLYAPSPFPHHTLSPSHSPHTISSSPHMTSSELHSSPPCMTLHLQSPQPMHTSTSPHLMPQSATTMIPHIHTMPPLEMDTSHPTFMLPASSSSFHTHPSIHETSTMTSTMATAVQSVNTMISHDISSPNHDESPPRRRRKSRNHAISSSLEALEAAKHSTSPAFSSAQLIIPGTSVIAVPPVNGIISNKPKKFQCPECGKGFTQKGGLINHSRIHAGERPFKCDYPGCERSFVQKCNRTRHYRVHTGEKPFECHLCSRRFNRKWGLITHIKSHEDATIMEMPAPSNSHPPTSTSDTDIQSPHDIIHTSPTIETSSSSSSTSAKRITRSRSRKRKSKIDDVHEMISHESMSMSSLSSAIPHPIPLCMSQSAPIISTSSTYDTPMPPLELFTPLKHEP